MRTSSLLSKVFVAMGICLMVLAIGAMPQSAQACLFCSEQDCGDFWSPPNCNGGACLPGIVGCSNCTCKKSAAIPTKCTCQ